MMKFINEKKFLSLIHGKSDVIPYIQAHITRFVHIINVLNNLFHPSEKPDNIKVLDFGSHTGVLGIALKNLGYDIHCIDIDKVIDGHLKNYTENNIKVDKLSPNWVRLPYPDNFFDLVIFSEVLEHLYDSPINYLSEFKRILKPNGFLLLTTPNVMRIENKLKFLLSINIYQDIERFCYAPRYSIHYREYSKTDLQLLLDRYLGFKNLKFHFFDYIGGRTKTRRVIQRFLFLFTALIPSWRTAILVTAQKPG